jgi:predicted phosphoribosyltransferase
VLFRDRHDAGRRLATRLARYAGRPDVIVLGLPRGGVPVAAEVARALGAPLDVLVVRKLGVPGHEELAMGALAPDGRIVLEEGVVRMLGLDGRTIQEVAAAEARELARRERAYRGARPALDLRGRTAILVDDGLATGSSMRAAAAAARARGAQHVVVAVPVAPPDGVDPARLGADEIEVVATPPQFDGVGRWYDDFTQTSDDEVRALLASLNAAGAESAR